LVNVDELIKNYLLNNLQRSDYHGIKIQKMAIECEKAIIPGEIHKGFIFASTQDPATVNKDKIEKCFKNLNHDLLHFKMKLNYNKDRLQQEFIQISKLKRNHWVVEVKKLFFYNYLMDHSKY